VRSLPERLRFLRTTAGITYSSVDELAGLRRGHARVVETGKRPYIEAHTVAALADVFGVTMDWLFRGLGDAPTDASVRDAVAKASSSGPKLKRISKGSTRRQRVSSRRRPQG
jgi:transcriptional regulator with XRE-family HTH domain